MKELKAIRVNTIIIFCIITSLIVASLLVLVIFRTDTGFVEMQSSASEYIGCQNAAVDLESASAYLTEQVQLFVISGDMRNMELYFEEANITKRRENAITELEKWYAGTDAMQLLKEAMDQSVGLMDTEYHAMRLAAEAYELDVDLLEEPVRNYKLTENELSLSKEKQRELALSLVSDKDYQSTRNTITNDVNGCMENIIAAVSNREEHASEIFKGSYMKLKISVFLLIALVVGVSIALRQVVVRPLKKYDDNVKAGTTLPLEGAYELQQLAETYNDVYEENQENQKLLRHEADHDALTKVFNRGAFDRLLRLYESGAANYALVMIDADHFKTINDTFGHAVGDLVLKRIADVLKEQFRSMDYICRIGGDEFAIIMVDVSSEQKEVLKSKLNAVRKELAQADGDIPAVTLSMGIAFSDRENPGTSIFKDADRVLYGVKENGRDGFSFF
ncbi:MAG: GGDEF domain-containing protein [Clostridia bacterium]|nr:GGDEF domain-containing protein [Clostridia bacterium]